MIRRFVPENLKGLAMTNRQIAIANAETSLARWQDYLTAAEAAGDAGKAAWGAARVAGARRRLRRLLRS
jgi:hypothetical protein